MQSQTASYVICSLLTKPTSSLLSTLDDVKDELTITDKSKDKTLTRLLTEASSMITRYCNRVFGVATWQDEFRPQRGVWGEGTRKANNPLALSHWPLADKPVSFVGNLHSASKLVDSIPDTSLLEEGMPIFGVGIPDGISISSVTPSSLMLSGNATLDSPAAALTAGMQITEIVGSTSTILVPGTDYEVDAGSHELADEGPAELYRLNQFGSPRLWPPARIKVVYRAGYVMPDQEEDSTLPADLSTACLRLVVGRYKSLGRDPMLVEQSQQGQLGTQRYWVGTLPSQNGSLPPEIEALVDQYRVPVIA